MSLENEIMELRKAVLQLTAAVLGGEPPEPQPDPDGGGDELPAGDFTQLFEVKDDKALLYRVVEVKASGALILGMYPSDKRADVPNRIKYLQGQRFLGEPARILVDGGGYAFRAKPGENGGFVIPYSEPLYVLAADVKKI